MTDSAQRPSLKARYADLFDRMSEATFLLDPQTLAILEANPAAERLLGLPTEALAGRNIDSWTVAAEAAALGRELRISTRRFFQRKSRWTWEVTVTEGGAPSRKRRTVETVSSLLVLNDETETLQVMARDITVELEAAEREERYRAELERLSTEDELTSLPNRRHFVRALNTEHARAERYSDRYSVIFLDVDHFKSFNDRNGHPAGDRLLKWIAGAIRGECRTSDQPARYGGEEMVILCSNTNAEGATVLAERVRARVMSCDFLEAKQQPMGFVSVSIGVASFPEHGASAEQVLKAADDALYRAKAGGRNRCVVYE